MTNETIIETNIRELDARSNGGIDVRLLWHPAIDALTVEVVSDDATFILRVAPSEALDAFHHPFAYAAFHGVRISSGVRGPELSATSA